MNSTTTRRIASMGVTALALPFLIFSQGASASANPTFGVDYFISPPLVQGTYATTGVTQITFDSATVNQSCPSNMTPPGSTVTVTVSGICNVQAGGDYGGATRTDGTAAHGGTRSNYANVGSGNIGANTNGATFTFSEPQVYMGIWWSAGSAQNRIRFYDGESEILSLTTADLFAAFGSAPTSDPLNTTSTLTAVDGTTTHPKHYYFGHPFGHLANPPVNRSTVTASEPFVFLHVFGSGGLQFDSVVLDGGGFEFDNLVVSTSAQTPAGNLVRIGGITGTPAAVPSAAPSTDPSPTPAPAVTTAPAPTAVAAAQPVTLASTGSSIHPELGALAFGTIAFGSLALWLRRAWNVRLETRSDKAD
jgi:hypothetical protein